MNIIRKIWLYLNWIFRDCEPKACTFEAYQDKIKIDIERKKAGQRPLKESMKNYRKAKK